MATFLPLEKHCGYPLIALNFFVFVSVTTPQRLVNQATFLQTLVVQLRLTAITLRQTGKGLFAVWFINADRLPTCWNQSASMSKTHLRFAWWLATGWILVLFLDLFLDCWVPMLFWNNYVTVCTEISEFLFLISCNLSYKFWFHVNLHPIMQMTPFNHKMMSHWLGLNAVFFFAVLMYQSCFEDSDWLWVTADHVPVFEATN